MKRLLRALLIVFAVMAYFLSGAPYVHAAEAAPHVRECGYIPLKTPWGYRVDPMDHYAFVWYCEKNYGWVWESYTGLSLTADLNANGDDVRKALGSLAAFMAADARHNTPETDPVLQDLARATAAANWPADPVWLVARNGLVTRPTYPVVSGIRSHTSNGRVITSLACSCKVLAIVEGSTTYCSVAGLANSGVGAPLPVGTVSVCARQ